MSFDPRSPAPWPRAQVAAIEAELRRRMLVVAPRPADFDYLRAAPEELALYGLPPKPDPEIAPRAFKLWKELVSAPLQPAHSVPLFQVTRSLPGYRLSSELVHAVGRQEASRNWSGAVIAARAEAPFRTIYGKWRIPEVRAPAGAQEGEEYVCSIWIGLDGHRRSSFSLPQIGTTQGVKIVNGQPQVSVHAWSQWWMRGMANPPIPFGGLALKTDDVVVCGLEVKSPQHVTLTLARVGGAPEAAPPRDMQAPPGAPLPLEYRVRGVAAEWIAERPTKWDSTDLYPLPDFDRIEFEDCVAHTPPHVRDLSAARMIRMVEARPLGAPDRAVVLARPSRFPNDRFRLSVEGLGLA